MERIEQIKRTIENNSKTIDKCSLKIQKLKEEIDKIDSKIKWIPEVELSDEGNKKLAKNTLGHGAFNAMPFNDEDARYLSRAKSNVKDDEIIALKNKREILEKDLEKCILERDNLKKENISLRLELNEIKNK